MGPRLDTALYKALFASLIRVTPDKDFQVKQLFCTVALVLGKFDSFCSYYIHITQAERKWR